MTTHYVDIVVKPSAEISEPQVLGALYDRLHRTLVQQQLDCIGISFPRYNMKPRSPGNLLRLHGANTALASLLELDWLKGVRDHVHIGELAQAPAQTSHRTVQRKQFKTNVERLRRRRMRRKGETEEQAAAAIPDTVERTPDLPYIHLGSLSTRQRFCMFIALGPPQEKASSGAFNTYGLSDTATVPWF